MIYKYKDFIPQIHESCFIAKSADIIGDVVIGENSSIWYNTVLRSDLDKMVIGKGTNIQDNSTIHNATDKPAIIGDYVTVGHQVLLHGCTIGNYALIGMGSTILDGAEIGDYTIIGANSLVTQNKKFPSGVLVMGSPAKVVRELTDEEKGYLKYSAEHYIESAKEHSELEIISE
ncbi:gamma carbonic anhydrase family protein [Vallitalea okinawensis]|uniref:gamma carbonic anhydrase family protein n=1 Tax=Vallitalea okinawensis TaxID=2078660 RepID=UPI000CFACFA7|nr:gamma carbonic anhydrase family protein [Vallitalea okinawensis]